MGCCRPSSSNGGTEHNPRASRKLGAIHESLNNVTPADVYLGRVAEILAERETIKRMTIDSRSLQHQLRAASTSPQMERKLPS